jgi:hypothetical protein
MGFRLISKGEQFLSQLTDALSDEKARREKDAVSLQRLQADVERLEAEAERVHKIELAALDFLAGPDWEKCPALAQACGVSVKQAPADDPWDRKPGRRYVAKTNLWCASAGMVVEVIAGSCSTAFLVKNLHIGQDFNGVGLDQDSWRLPTKLESLLQYEHALAGTLVTSFEELKVGDKVRIERKRGDVPQVGFPAVQNDYVLEDTLAQFYDDSWGKWWGTTEGHCLDLREVTNGRVRLLSSAPRKPYVKDGRWVAEVGDRFRHLRDRRVVVTVLDVPSDFTGLYSCKWVRDGKSQETHTYVLNENNWEPVS